MSSSNNSKVFDYRVLRLLVGIIAFAIPICVTIISSDSLSSISASYFTKARDAFVGMLFIVSAFLWAYNGHSKTQSYMSKIAAVSAIFVAVFPTVRDNCETSTTSVIHYVSAFILFSILTYFCLGPFRKNTRGKGGKKGRRSIIYLICGLIMFASMLGIGIGEIALSDELMATLRITYWAETIALFSFGCAWMVAGKYFKPLVDKDEELYLIKR